MSKKFRFLSAVSVMAVCAIPVRAMEGSGTMVLQPMDVLRNTAESFHTWEKDYKDEVTLSSANLGDVRELTAHVCNALYITLLQEMSSNKFNVEAKDVLKMALQEIYERFGILPPQSSDNQGINLEYWRSIAGNLSSDLISKVLSFFQVNGSNVSFNIMDTQMRVDITNALAESFKTASGKLSSIDAVSKKIGHDIQQYEARIKEQEKPKISLEDTCANIRSILHDNMDEDLIRPDGQIRIDELLFELFADHNLGNIDGDDLKKAVDKYMNGTVNDPNSRHIFDENMTKCTSEALNNMPIYKVEQKIVEKCPELSPNMSRDQVRIVLKKYLHRFQLCPALAYVMRAEVASKSKVGYVYKFISLLSDPELIMLIASELKLPYVMDQMQAICDEISKYEESHQTPKKETFQYLLAQCFPILRKANIRRDLPGFALQSEQVSCGTVCEHIEQAKAVQLVQSVQAKDERVSSIANGVSVRDNELYASPAEISSIIPVSATPQVSVAKVLPVNTDQEYLSNIAEGKVGFNANQDSLSSFMFEIPYFKPAIRLADGLEKPSAGLGDQVFDSIRMSTSSIAALPNGNSEYSYNITSMGLDKDNKLKINSYQIPMRIVQSGIQVNGRSPYEVTFLQSNNNKYGAKSMSFDAVFSYVTETKNGETVYTCQLAVPDVHSAKVNGQYRLIYIPLPAITDPQLQDYMLSPENYPVHSIQDATLYILSGMKAKSNTDYGYIEDITPRVIQKSNTSASVSIPIQIEQISADAGIDNLISSGVSHGFLSGSYNPKFVHEPVGHLVKLDKIGAAISPSTSTSSTENNPLVDNHEKGLFTSVVQISDGSKFSGIAVHNPADAINNVSNALKDVNIDVAQVAQRAIQNLKDGITPSSDNTSYKLSLGKGKEEQSISMSPQTYSLINDISGFLSTMLSLPSTQSATVMCDLLKEIATTHSGSLGPTREFCLSSLSRANQIQNTSDTQISGFQTLLALDLILENINSLSTLPSDEVVRLTLGFSDGSATIHDALAKVLMLSTSCADNIQSGILDNKAVVSTISVPNLQNAQAKDMQNSIMIARGNGTTKINTSQISEGKVFIVGRSDDSAQTQSKYALYCNQGNDPSISICKISDDNASKDVVVTNDAQSVSLFNFKEEKGATVCATDASESELQRAGYLVDISNASFTKHLGMHAAINAHLITHQGTRVLQLVTSICLMLGLKFDKELLNKIVEEIIAKIHSKNDNCDTQYEDKLSAFALCLACYPQIVTADGIALHKAWTSSSSEDVLHSAVSAAMTGALKDLKDLKVNNGLIQGVLNLSASKDKNNMLGLLNYLSISNSTTSSDRMLASFNFDSNKYMACAGQTKEGMEFLSNVNVQLCPASDRYMSQLKQECAFKVEQAQGEVPALRILDAKKAKINPSTFMWQKSKASASFNFTEHDGENGNNDSGNYYDSQKNTLSTQWGNMHVNDVDDNVQIVKDCGPLQCLNDLQKELSQYMEEESSSSVGVIVNIIKEVAYQMGLAHEYGIIPQTVIDVLNLLTDKASSKDFQELLFTLGILHTINQKLDSTLSDEAINNLYQLCHHDTSPSSKQSEKRAFLQNYMIDFISGNASKEVKDALVKFMKGDFKVLKGTEGGKNEINCIALGGLLQQCFQDATADNFNIIYTDNTGGIKAWTTVKDHSQLQLVEGLHLKPFLKAVEYVKDRILNQNAIGSIKLTAGADANDVIAANAYSTSSISQAAQKEIQAGIKLAQKQNASDDAEIYSGIDKSVMPDKIKFKKKITNAGGEGAALVVDIGLSPTSDATVNGMLFDTSNDIDQISLTPTAITGKNDDATVFTLAGLAGQDKGAYVAALGASSPFFNLVPQSVLHSGAAANGMFCMPDWTKDIVKKNDGSYNTFNGIETQANENTVLDYGRTYNIQNNTPLAQSQKDMLQRILEHLYSSDLTQDNVKRIQAAVANNQNNQDLLSSFVVFSAISVDDQFAYDIARKNLMMCLQKSNLDLSILNKVESDNDQRLQKSIKQGIIEKSHMPDDTAYPILSALRICMENKDFSDTTLGIGQELDKYTVVNLSNVEKMPVDGKIKLEQILNKGWKYMSLIDICKALKNEGQEFTKALLQAPENLSNLRIGDEQNVNLSKIKIVKHTKDGNGDIMLNLDALLSKSPFSMQLTDLFGHKSKDLLTIKYEGKDFSDMLYAIQEGYLAQAVRAEKLTETNYLFIPDAINPPKTNSLELNAIISRVRDIALAHRPNTGYKLFAHIAINQPEFSNGQIFVVVGCTNPVTQGSSLVSSWYASHSTSTDQKAFNKAVSAILNRNNISSSGSASGDTNANALEARQAKISNIAVLQDNISEDILQDVKHHCELYKAKTLLESVKSISTPTTSSGPLVLSKDRLCKFLTSIDDNTLITLINDPTALMMAFEAYIKAIQPPIAPADVQSTLEKASEILNVVRQEFDPFVLDAPELVAGKGAISIKTISITSANDLLGTTQERIAVADVPTSIGGNSPLANYAREYGRAFIQLHGYQIVNQLTPDQKSSLLPAEYNKEYKLPTPTNIWRTSGTYVTNHSELPVSELSAPNVVANMRNATNGKARGIKITKSSANTVSLPAIYSVFASSEGSSGSGGIILQNADTTQAISAAQTTSSAQTQGNALNVSASYIKRLKNVKALIETLKVDTVNKCGGQLQAQISQGTAANSATLLYTENNDKKSPAYLLISPGQKLQTRELNDFLKNVSAVTGMKYIIGPRSIMKLAYNSLLGSKSDVQPDISNDSSDEFRPAVTSLSSTSMLSAKASMKEMIHGTMTNTSMSVEDRFDLLNKQLSELSNKRVQSPDMLTYTVMNTQLIAKYKLELLVGSLEHIKYLALDPSEIAKMSNMDPFLQYVNNFVKHQVDNERLVDRQYLEGLVQKLPIASTREQKIEIIDKVLTYLDSIGPVNASLNDAIKVLKSIDLKNMDENAELTVTDKNNHRTQYQMVFKSSKEDIARYISDLDKMLFDQNQKLSRIPCISYNQDSKKCVIEIKTIDINDTASSAILDSQAGNAQYLPTKDQYSVNLQDNTLPNIINHLSEQKRKADEDKKAAEAKQKQAEDEARAKKKAAEEAKKHKDTEVQDNKKTIEVDNDNISELDTDIEDETETVVTKSLKTQDVKLPQNQTVEKAV